MKPSENSYEPRRPAWSRPETVFIAAALTLLAALLVPFSPAVLAVLWVCTFCLAGAVAIICLAAGSSTDLIGFVPMVSSLGLLRLAALAASARRIIQHEPADPLLQGAGLFLAGKWPLGAVLVCLLLAAVISVVVFASSQKITLACAGYANRILPLKRIGIETDLRMGVIDQPQAKQLARRIGSEFRFFAGMQGVSLLMKAEAAMGVITLLACVLLAVLGGSSNTASEAFLTQTAPSVVGLALFSMLPLAIAAVCCGGMMGRDTLALRADSGIETAPPARKISIIARDSGAREEIEVLNPDALGQTDAAQQFVTFEPATTAPASSRAAASSFERELQSLQNAADAPLADAKAEFRCRSAEDYYEKLSRRILAQWPNWRQVILAAQSVTDLPVSVAVNVAIRLAQKNKKTLLVDTDTARQPLARVFDMDPAVLQKKTLGTCFENLSVLAAGPATIGKLLQNPELTGRYAAILLYVPECGDLKLASSETVGGFFFSQAPQAANPPAFCNLLTPVPPVQAALKSAI